MAKTIGIWVDGRSYVSDGFTNSLIEAGWDIERFSKNDIENEEKGTNRPALTLKQVGRIITEMGVAEAANQMNETVIAATADGERKNG